MTYPGPHPITGDHVDLVLDNTSVTVTGSSTVRGVTTAGQGYAELTLCDADPQHRRALEATTSVQYSLYQGGALLYASPPLHALHVSRAKSGALIITAAP
ncbi:hypothetical protein ACF073_40875 [Streptomyces sp. NPDC015171]|uniref:hypothetical protein n=1 Tax=Streptomyces sp. NPDC015171 TaxID=3364945 RepID=UPI0036F57E71